MVQQDPFADFPDAPPGGSPAPAQPAQGPVYGPPATQDPTEAERLRLAREAAARAEKAEQRAQETFEGTGGKPAEGDKKAGSFLIRALGANAGFEQTGLGGRNLFAQAFQDTLPDVSNTIINSDERQVADVAQREFIAAVLRLDSGAAIPPEEENSYKRLYFPQPGDGEDVIEFKRQARERAIAGLRISAGPLADEAMAEFEKLSQSIAEPDPREATREDEAPLGLETGFDQIGRDDPFDRAQYLQREYGVNPGQETRLVGLINANIGNPNLSMAMLRGIYEQAGVRMPAPEQAQKLLEDMRSGNVGPTTGIDTSAAEREYTEGLDQAIAAQGSDPSSMTETAAVGIASGGTMFLNDEITGVGSAIEALLSGENPATAYEVNRDIVRRFRDRSYEENPITAFGSELVGSAVTGGRMFGTPTNALQAARIGGTEAAVAGFGSGDGAFDSTANALLAAPLGAGLGAGIQVTAQRYLGNRANRITQDPREVVAAGERRGVTVRRADVDPAMRGRRADAMQTDGRRTIQAAEADDLAQMEESLLRNLQAETGEGAGQAFNRGERIQSGATNAVKQARQKAGRLYDQARAEAGDIKIEPRTALRVVNEQIAELEEAGRNANKAQIDFLEGLRADLGRSGGVGIDVLRGQRTNLRGNISTNNLSMTDAERRASLVLDALAEDIKIGLRGNPALGKFRQADNIWRKQAEFQNNIVRKLVGSDANVPAETAARRVEAFIGGDYRRAKALLDELGPDARRAVREQVAVSLGRNAKGEFSIPFFLKHTGSGRGSLLQPQTARLLFGEDGVKAIEDLRLLAQAKRDAADPSNTSNTGGIVNRAARGLRRVMLGSFGLGVAMDAGGGMGLGTLAAAGTTLGGEFVERLGRERTMRLLLNPDFTGWLKRLPNSSDPQIINRSFERLRSIATRTPGMVADVGALERAIISAVNDNSAARVAAEEQPQENQ